MSLSHPDPLTRGEAGAWLPWISFPAVAGAAGLADPAWWWLALLVGPLAIVLAPRFLLAARCAVALAALCAGGGMMPHLPAPPAGDRLLDVQGTVTSVPFHGWTQGVVLAVEASDDPDGYAPRRLFVKTAGELGLRPGDTMAARGRWIRDVRGPVLLAVEAERRERREDGPRGWAWQAIDRLRRHHELAGALLLGRGDPPEKAAFRSTGLLHVLAVSGMHLAIAAGLLIWLLRQIGLAWSTRLLALAVLVCGYTWLTGASPATVRALAMALAVIVYDLSARESTRLGPLALAALALLLLDPSCARDLGFQLSLAAVLGILTLGHELIAYRHRWCPLDPWPLDRPIWRVQLWLLRAACDGICIGVAATLFTAPLLIQVFGALAPLSPLTTLAASPPATLALWVGLPLLLLAGTWPGGPWEPLYRLLEWSLDALVDVVHFATALPGQMPVDPWWAVPSGLAVLALTLVRAPRDTCATAPTNDSRGDSTSPGNG